VLSVRVTLSLIFFYSPGRRRDCGPAWRNLCMAVGKRPLVRQVQEVSVFTTNFKISNIRVIKNKRLPSIIALLFFPACCDDNTQVLEPRPLYIILYHWRKRVFYFSAVFFRFGRACAGFEKDDRTYCRLENIIFFPRSMILYSLIFSKTSSDWDLHFPNSCILAVAGLKL